MKIEFLMPVMRPKSALLVLDDLSNQSLLINKITIVDNNGDFKLVKKYPFEVEILPQKENIGVNAVWNKMFDINADYIGLIGDDYRLNKNLIKNLKDAFLLYNDIGISTAIIFKDTILNNSGTGDLTGRHVPGKGHLGACLFKKCILDQLPLIPKEFKIFFGDNWLGWWIEEIGYKIYEISTGVSHKHKIDLKVKLNYPEIIKKERGFWRNWLRRRLEL